MGVILDSSVVIAAERRRDSVAAFLRQVTANAGDQAAALSSVGVTELIHGLYRALTQDAKSRRERFLEELLGYLTVHPYTRETALVAGRIGGEQQARGINIPFSDLLIGRRLFRWILR